MDGPPPRTLDDMWRDGVLKKPELTARHQWLRAHLKTWERAFKQIKQLHRRKKLTQQDIEGQHDASIKAQYREYTKLCKLLDGSEHSKPKQNLPSSRTIQAEPPQRKETLPSNGAVKRKRDAADEQDEPRSRKRDCDKENQPPRSRSASSKRHNKRAPDGRFRSHTRAPEAAPSHPKTNAQAASNPKKRRHIDSQSNGSQKSGKVSISFHRRVPDPDPSDSGDPDWTPKTKRTFVHPTPKKYVSIGMFDHEESFSDKHANAPTSSDLTAGHMQLRSSEKAGTNLVWGQSATIEEFSPKPPGQAGVKVFALSRPASPTRKLTVNPGNDTHMDVTPSKGKSRATSVLPEATPTHAHRFQRTPPSSSRRRSFAHFMEAPTPSSTVNNSKRRRLDDDDLAFADAVIDNFVFPSAETGMLTPNSKPSSSSASQHNQQQIDDAATPEFLRFKSRFRPGFNVSDSTKNCTVLFSGATSTATPSKRRSQSVGGRSFSRAKSALPNLTSTKQKLVSQLAREAQNRSESSMDEAQEAMDNYIAEQITEVDAEDGGLQGSSDNPYHRKKKVPKRQTRKLNLPPKPAVAHCDRAVTTVDEDDPSGNSNLPVMSMAKIRGEAERKPQRSETPSVDSRAFAVPSMEGSSASASPIKTHGSGNGRAQPEPRRSPSPVMVNKTKPDRLKSATKEQSKKQNNSSKVVKKAKKNAPLNLVRHKNLSRGKKPHRNRGTRST